jgi:microsomal epoxide hydrolase
MSASLNAVPHSNPDQVWTKGTSLDGFHHRFATIAGVRVHYVEGGRPDGEVLLLVAGFPESWYAWRHVMPLLGERYRIIAPDLPGQGDSDCPADGYDTLSLAHALHGLLLHIGVRRYNLVAHDVGAWVAWPYAATFGDEVVSLTLLDAGIPGITLPDALPVAPDKAWRTWHFAFHTIPDLPEALIAGKERVYLDWFLRRKTANPRAFSEADLDEYERVFKRAGGLRAGLAYYRSAVVSAVQNKSSVEGSRLHMPVLAVSADQGSIPDMAGPLRPYADNVTGVEILHCGHFIPEEQPGALVTELLSFIERQSDGEKSR